MKLHEHEYLWRPVGEAKFCFRLAVPGGWVYAFGSQYESQDRGGWGEDVQGTCFVPDPYAFHVKGKGKGKGKDAPVKFPPIDF